MRARTRTLRLVAGAALLLAGCRGATRSERARVLALTTGDPVESAVAAARPGGALVLVYWPKVGACQACATGISDALREFAGRSSTTRLFEVWPEGAAMPSAVRLDGAVQVGVERGDYARQTQWLGTPRLEAWRSGRLVLLQTLDERRANADFVAQVLDHCLGAS